MRICNNCGWENPNEAICCEKCLIRFDKIPTGTITSLQTIELNHSINPDRQTDRFVGASNMRHNAGNKTSGLIPNKLQWYFWIMFPVFFLYNRNEKDRRKYGLLMLLHPIVIVPIIWFVFDYYPIIVYPFIAVLSLILPIIRPVTKKYKINNSTLWIHMGMVIISLGLSSIFTYLFLILFQGIIGLIGYVFKHRWTSQKSYKCVRIVYFTYFSFSCFVSLVIFLLLLFGFDS